MIQTVQIVKITHTHMRTNSAVGVQTPTHTNMHTQKLTQTHILFI